MKKGDVVTIYEDPLTEQKLEGQARLIRRIKDGFALEYWLVQFTNNDSDIQYGRWIKKQELTQK